MFGKVPPSCLAEVTAVHPEAHSVSIRYLRGGGGGCQRVPVMTQHSGPEDEGNTWLPPKGATVKIDFLDGIAKPIVVGCLPFHKNEPVTRDPDERMWKHRSGSFERIYADGKRHLKAVKQALSEFLDNFVLKVGKSHQVLVGQDYELRVQGKVQVFAQGQVVIDAMAPVLARLHGGLDVRAANASFQTAGNFSVESQANASIKANSNASLESAGGTASVKGVGGIFESGLVGACTFCPILGAHFGAAGNTARSSHIAPAIPIP